MNKTRYIPSIILLTIVVAVLACSDDETFHDDDSAQYITFSADTIQFDTIFTTVGSATKEFKIFNPTSKGVRLSSVRLASGGSSGFRVNLDGRYGTQFNDVEIYHGDSIYCFVEVTVPSHDSDSPILLTDSLLFQTTGGQTFKVHLSAVGRDAIFLGTLLVQDDDTLGSNRPIVVMDSIVVAAGATLTIAPGTTLYFHRGAGIAVHGRLLTDGTPEAPVTLRGDRTDRLFTYLPYDRLDAQWQGIHLYPESMGNRITHTDIHGGNYGVVADPTPPDSASTLIQIENSIIHNVAGYGLYLHGANARITGSQITNARSGCVVVIGGNTLFTHCTIAQFYPWAADHGPALQFANVADSKEVPLYGIEMRNCIITGYSSDEVYGARMTDSDAPFVYMFRNCLVNTVLTDEDTPYFPDCLLDQDSRKKDTSTSSDEETTPLREANFRTIDTQNFIYDFALDSLSPARHLASPQYIDPLFPSDLRGTPRPQQSPDAGCYQSTFTDTDR